MADSKPPDTGRAAPHLLLVEDNDVNRLFTEALLRQSGWRIESARDGFEALEALRARRFDAILMDIQMPGMDGLETTAALRRIEAQGGTHTPVIGLTAETVEGDRASALRAGMDAYLTKPLNPKLLASTVESLLAGAEPAGEEGSAVDVSTLLRETRGNVEFIRQLAQDFRGSCERMLETLRKALEGGDARAVVFAAHQLRSPLKIFGASRADELALEVERIGRTGTLSGAAAALAPLEEELARVLDDLAKV